MKHAIIFLVRTSRYAPPRVGQFIYNNEFEKFLYLGRPLTLDEFNEHAGRVLDQPNPNIPYAISVRVVDVKAKEDPVAPVSEQEVVEPQPVEEAQTESEATDAPEEVEPESEADSQPEPMAEESNETDPIQTESEAIDATEGTEAEQPDLLGGQTDGSRSSRGGRRRNQ